MIIYDEFSKFPLVKYLPDGKVKAKRWWWPPDRRKAQLLTKILNSDGFKKSFIGSQPNENT